MKLILLISLLLSHFLLAAKEDSASHITIRKPGRCRILVAGKYKNRDTVPLAEIVNGPFMACECGEILYFDLSFPCSGVYVDTHMSGNVLPSVIIPNLTKYTWLLLKNITYKTTDGQIKNLPGMTIIVKK
jgi:hypothetical protein